VTRITVKGTNWDAEAERPPLFEVLQIPNAGPSPRGSTYYKTFQHCPFEFYVSVICGLRPEREAEPLTIGLLWHYLLELYYKAIREHQLATREDRRDPNWLYGGANKGADQVYGMIDKLRAAQGYVEIADIAQRMFDGYLERYDRRDPVRVIAMEETLCFQSVPAEKRKRTKDKVKRKLPIVDAASLEIIDFSTRLDLVVEDFDRGGMWVREHKSCRSITDDLLSSYGLDLQVLGEIWALVHCVDLSQYPPLQGVVVNLASKAKEPKYYHHAVALSDAHLKNFQKTIATRPRMLELAATLGWPKYLGNCAGFARGYSTCSFYSLCHDWPTLEVTPDSDPPPGYTRRTDETYISEADV
jgi:PD-(D/E)XK nuclease superfamily protein